MKRGGGSDGDHEYVVSNIRDTSSCEAFCNSLMVAGGVGWDAGGNTWGEDPYYIKCFDNETALPLNGIRVAFASQFGTTNIDPALPGVTPYTNMSACMRMTCYLLSYFFSAS